MSFFWRRRILSDILEDIEELMKEIERTVMSGIERFERYDFVPGRREVRGPIVYGVRITIGPDGKPIVEEFGNVRRVGRRPIIEETIEPLVDIIDEKDRIVVVAEIPGVDKDKIDVRVKDDKLIIKAENEKRKYYKEIKLPQGVKPETARAKYKNGVLEIIIEKEASKEEEEGTRVRIE